MRSTTHKLSVMAGLCAFLALPVVGADLDEADLNTRIEKLRKGDFTVKLLDKDGKPITGTVKYELKRHAFPFGTCINHRFFKDNPDEDDKKYLECLEKYFNSAVHDKYLKWKFVEPERGKADLSMALKQWQWCHDHGLTMRGHCIFFGIERHVQPWVKQLNKDELATAMKTHAERVLTAFKGKITDYDLNNEMMHGDYYAHVLELKSGAEYFKWCKAIAPEAKFYVNEFNILGSNEVNKYVAHIKNLLADDAELGGIGDQGFFRRAVPDNITVRTILDRLAQFNLPITITEFGQGTSDEAQQAADLRRFYKLCFAHPSVNGIYMWGFWEGDIQYTTSALWKKDWTLKPSGEAYVKLLTEEWISKGQAQATEDGTIRLRGFYGDYQFDTDGTLFIAKLASSNTIVTASVGVQSAKKQ